MMSIRKHATGEVLPPQDEQQPVADDIQVLAGQQTWTVEDESSLADESTQG
jgi:hypothetical protein